MLRILLSAYSIIIVIVTRCARECDSQWEWESNGNPMGMGIKHGIENGNGEWDGREWELNRQMGGNGNVKSHSRTPLIVTTMRDRDTSTLQLMYP